MKRMLTSRFEKFPTVFLPRVSKDRACSEAGVSRVCLEPLPVKRMADRSMEPFQESDRMRDVSAGTTLSDLLLMLCDDSVQRFSCGEQF